ncbi:MAG: ATP-binding protein, partial [Chloroflexota bacterium]
LDGINSNLAKTEAMLAWLSEIIETLNPLHEAFPGDAHAVDDEIFEALKRYYIDREAWKILEVDIPSFDRRRKAGVARLYQQIEALEIESRQRSDTSQEWERLEADYLSNLLDNKQQAHRSGPSDQPPYRGMAVFEEAHAPFFFGREALVDELVDGFGQALKDPDRKNFLAIIGASGSGKSSLVRAGILPAFRARGCQISIATPTSDPLRALAEALYAEEDSPSPKVDELVSAMAASAEALDRWLITHQTGSKRLLVIDQFEELFTLCDDAEVRQAFVDNLLLAINSPQRSQLAVILTLRADFYHRVAWSAPLRELLEQHQKFIGRMGRDDLRQTIEGPAAAAGLSIQLGLVDLILDDIGNEPGSLPLLSHALLETWKRRGGVDGQTLTLVGYAEAGGVSGAIAKTGDAALDRLNPDQQGIARNIFTRLTELGEGSEDTRRRANITELIPKGADVDEIVEVLAQLATDRLITVDQNQVDVAHEVLIREWDILRRWLDADRQGLRILDQLNGAASFWEAHGRREVDLYSGTRLRIALDWERETNPHLSALESEYLFASQAAFEKEKKEEARRGMRELEQQKAIAKAQQARAEEAETAAIRLRRRRNVAFGLAALGMIFASVAFYFFREANLNARDIELRNMISMAAAQLPAVGNPDQNSAERAMLMWRQGFNFEQRGEVDVSDQFLYDQAQRTFSDLPPQFATFYSGFPSLSAIATSVSRERFALISEGDVPIYGSVVSIWDYNDEDDGFTPVEIQRYELDVNVLFWQLAFSEDGNWLAVMALDYDDIVDSAFVIDLTQDSDQAIYRLPLTDSSLHSFGLSPSGRYLIVTDQSGGISRYETQTGEQAEARLTPPALNEAFVLLSVAPDATSISGITESRRLITWQIDSDAAFPTLNDPISMSQ